MSDDDTRYERELEALAEHCRARGLGAGEAPTLLCHGAALCIRSNVKAGAAKTDEAAHVIDYLRAHMRAVVGLDGDDREEHHGGTH